MEQNDNRRDTGRQKSAVGATRNRNTNRNYNNATSRERAKRSYDYGKDRADRERDRSSRRYEREVGNYKKDELNTDDYSKKSTKRNYKPNSRSYDYNESPFFSKSSVNGNVKIRTNRADDYFENKDYKPWDMDDEFNISTKGNTSGERPRVKRKLPVNASKLDSLKTGVGRVSKRVLASSGSDENYYVDEQEYDSIADNIKNTRNNKRLLDELNNKKKPLTKRQRKFKNVMFACGIALGVLVVGLVLSLTVLFRCEKIVVEGVTRYKEADIIAASSLGYGKNIFLANKTVAADKIEAMYPYIEEAQIRLSIPNTLKINVTEATPEYYIQDGTRYYIISKNSKLLEQVIERDQNIPTIIGCKLKDPKVGETVNVENSKVITVLNQVAESMTANAVTGIKEINLSDMANIELNYEDRITIVIGMPEDINYKIRTAMTIIYTKLSETDSGRLNCSNLVESRTDGKSNQSSFRPNNLIVEDVTEPTTELPTEEYQTFDETPVEEVEEVEEVYEAEETEEVEEVEVTDETEESEALTETEVTE